ncbi:hypothetical protein JZ751_014007, partial [Albula glossodonta]
MPPSESRDPVTMVMDKCSPVAECKYHPSIRQSVPSDHGNRPSDMIWASGALGLHAFRPVAEEVKEYFAQFGQIKKCILPFDKETGFHRGFCRIGYITEEGLHNALQREAHVIEGSRGGLRLTQQCKRCPLASGVVLEIFLSCQLSFTWSCQMLMSQSAAKKGVT